MSIWCDIKGLQNTCMLYFSFLLLCFSFSNKPTEWTCQIDLRNKSAKLWCRNESPNWDALFSAEKSHSFHLPKWDAILACQIDLPEKPPSPPQNSQAGPGSQIPPPPPPMPTPCNGGEGEGRGGQPRPPEHPEQVLLLSFPLRSQLRMFFMT